ncbi:MAG: DUF2207 domain-containing protein [Xanthomonadales bacterium]|nr:DUF2207 domain-containing protein [Xanthomonadales bacterium]
MSTSTISGRQGEWRRWLRFLPAVLLAMAAFSVAGLASAAEQILDYDIDIQVQADASLEVTEQITVLAQGRQIRRGIYRDFPTRYRDRHGNRVVVELDVLDVLRDGRPEPWFTEDMANGVRINTGDDTFLENLPAQIRYTLRYRTTRQLHFSPDRDELYWNAIGTGWDFPIRAGSVRVRLPAPVPAAQMTVEGYTGRQGTQGQDYRAGIDSPGQASWQLTRPLSAGEGLTIVITFPKGLVAEPGRGQRLLWLLKDNVGVLIALAGLIVLVVYCLRRWRQVGRDPRPGVIIARYEPPPGWSPGDLRYLTRGCSYDTRTFSADLLHLAVAGKVRVHRNRRRLRQDRWTLERLAGIDQTAGQGAVSLAPAALFGTLFSRNGEMLELGQSNASRLQAGRAAHEARLKQNLKGSHHRVNAGSTVIAFAILLVSMFLALIAAHGAGVPYIIGLGVLMLLVAVSFASLVQAPTPEGRKLLDWIQGLKLYLGVAERQELSALPGPGQPPPLDAARYQQLLPYAVALDVEEAWTRQFTLAAGATAAAAAGAGLAWYRGAGGNDLGGLAKAVGSGLSRSIASASTPPGSSSGSGGGGSSGGGGGGGGGGGR